MDDHDVRMLEAQPPPQLWMARKSSQDTSFASLRRILAAVLNRSA
jgi:hypothetical protein